MRRGKSGLLPAYNAIYFRPRIEYLPEVPYYVGSWPDGKCEPTCRERGTGTGDVLSLSRLLLTAGSHFSSIPSDSCSHDHHLLPLNHVFHCRVSASLSDSQLCPRNSDGLISLWLLGGKLPPAVSYSHWTPQRDLS